MREVAASQDGERLIKLIVWQVPKSLNGLLRMYKYPWKYAKYRDDWGWVLKAAASPNERSALGQMAKSGKRMKVNISMQHTRLYDRDNLYGSVKPVVDSLVELGWLVGDSDKRVDLAVTQVKGQPDKTIILMELL